MSKWISRRPSLFFFFQESMSQSEKVVSNHAVPGPNTMRGQTEIVAPEISQNCKRCRGQAKADSPMEFTSFPGLFPPWALFTLVL